VELWVFEVMIERTHDYSSREVMGLYRKRKKAIKHFEKAVGQKTKWSKSPSSGAWECVTEIPGIVHASMFRFPIGEAIGRLGIKEAIRAALIRDEKQASAFNKFLSED
jgi:hypothetical protein